MDKVLQFENAEFERELFGNYDKNIKILEDIFKVSIVLRDSKIILLSDSQENKNLCAKAIEQIYRIFEKNKIIQEQDVRYIGNEILKGEGQNLSTIGDDVILVTSKGDLVKPKTKGQKKYVNDIQNNDMTICVGPAGTGKTYLAVAVAASLFKKGEISRIVLTRPIVEAGESLGFLPGDLNEKVDPYVRPLYDALFVMFGDEKFHRFLDMGIIEVAPLAFMRGRTLDNSFIILDEAQNTTKEQMKMFLTRFGFNSKAVITGDITQIDIENKSKSGLFDALTILDGLKGIKIDKLTKDDVVRHELVQRIIAQYEKFEELKKKKKLSEK